VIGDANSLAVKIYGESAHSEMCQETSTTLTKVVEHAIEWTAFSR